MLDFNGYLRVDHNYLASSYHSRIIAGFMLISSYLASSHYVLQQIIKIRRNSLSERTSHWKRASLKKAIFSILRRDFPAENSPDKRLARRRQRPHCRLREEAEEEREKPRRDLLLLCPVIVGFVSFSLLVLILQRVLWAFLKIISVNSPLFNYLTDGMRRREC